MHSGPNPQQEPGKVPASTHMGPPSTYISDPAAQAFQHLLPPYLKPPTGSPLPSHCPSSKGAHTFLGKYTW